MKQNPKFLMNGSFVSYIYSSFGPVLGSEAVEVVITKISSKLHSYTNGLVNVDFYLSKRFKKSFDTVWPKKKILWQWQVFAFYGSFFKTLFALKS